MFQKGTSGNPNGRPKGSRNKCTLRLRESINDFLADNFEELKKDFKKLEVRDRIKFYLDMLQYGLPKLRAVEFSSEFERLNNEEIDLIIKKLRDGANEKNGQAQVFGRT